MYLAVLVGKFVKQVVREWCPPHRFVALTESLVEVAEHEG